MEESKAYRFFHDWLWGSPKRETDSMPWGGEYQRDVISMLVDATEPLEKELAANAELFKKVVEMFQELPKQFYNSYAVMACGYCGAWASKIDKIQHKEGCYWINVQSILPEVKKAAGVDSRGGRSFGEIPAGD